MPKSSHVTEKLSQACWVVVSCAVLAISGCVGAGGTSPYGLGRAPEKTTYASTATTRSESTRQGIRAPDRSFMSTYREATVEPQPQGIRDVKEDERPIVRAQSPEPSDINSQTPGNSDHYRQGMQANEIKDEEVEPAQFQQVAPPTNGVTAPLAPPYDQNGLLTLPPPPPAGWDVGPDIYQTPTGQAVDLNPTVYESRTGQFMVGVGVNSDAGVTGQIILDERNFDWTRVPSSWDDIINGTAFRGAGQGFRLEAVPGNQVQRYLVSFTEPYLFDTQISLNVSGFFYNRRFFDWDEQRLGGRVAFGYRLTPDLSFTTALRMEDIDISDPRVTSVPELNEVVGDNALFSPRFTLAHDTRDVPFLPTEGHYFEISYEQVFGDFDYPRAELDYRKYFLVTERPDGSGRHTLAFSSRLGVSGSQTPIFENFFAGGYSTLRGFDFRGASPMVNSVRVGGELRFLGSLEYMFPLTADDMIRGVAFCDFGTVEEELHVEWDDFRVAPGLGLRISIPALGPAPIALDFAVPVAREDTDDIENFSFFFGFGRS